MVFDMEWLPVGKKQDSAVPASSTATNGQSRDALPQPVLAPAAGEQLEPAIARAALPLEATYAGRAGPVQATLVESASPVQTTSADHAVPAQASPAGDAVPVQANPAENAVSVQAAHAGDAAPDQATLPVPATPEAVGPAVAALASGGVIAVPTDTLYGESTPAANCGGNPVVGAALIESLPALVVVLPVSVGGQVVLVGRATSGSGVGSLSSFRWYILLSHRGATCGAHVSWCHSPVQECGASLSCMVQIPVGDLVPTPAPCTHCFAQRGVCIDRVT